MIARDHEHVLAWNLESFAQLLEKGEGAVVLFLAPAGSDVSGDEEELRSPLRLDEIRQIAQQGLEHDVLLPVRAVHVEVGEVQPTQRLGRLGQRL